MTLYSSEIEWEKNGYGYDDAVGFIPKSGSSGYDAEQDTKINKNTQDIATNTTNDEIRQQQVDTNTEKIDSLEYVISTLENKKDSLAIERDTIKIEIEKVITKYEKIRNTIINNSPDSDYIFFSNYLDWYRTIKGN